MRICDLETCDRKHYAKGLCQYHWRRQRKGQRLDPDPELDQIDRFWEKVERTDDCWNWTAAQVKGHGVIWWDGRLQYAHRVSYILHGGEIPDGLEVDHQCRNRACVNPAHLIVATSGENSQNQAIQGRGNITGHRGVYPDRRLGGYYVQVTHQGKTRSWSGFKDLETAAAFVSARRSEIFTNSVEDRTTS